MHLHVIVEVEGFEGEAGEIVVRNDRQSGTSTRDSLFCAGKIGDDGVVRFVDWGYATVAEARAAWPDALDAQGAAAMLATVASPAPPAR